MRKTSKKGFTLVEVVVTVALLSAVGVLCASLVFMSINHSRQNAQKSAFQIGVNKFIAVLNNRVNSAGNGDIVVNKGTENGEEKNKSKEFGNQTTFRVIAKSETEYYIFEDGSIYLSKDMSVDSDDSMIVPYVRAVKFSYNDETKLLNIRVQSDLDDGWLATSFYIRQVMSDEKSAS